jgi:hypothetical protein
VPCEKLTLNGRRRVRCRSTAAGSFSIRVRWRGRRSPASGLVRFRRAATGLVDTSRRGPRPCAQARRSQRLLPRGGSAGGVPGAQRRVRRHRGGAGAADGAVGLPALAAGHRPHHGRCRRATVRDLDVRQPGSHPQGRMDRSRGRGQAWRERRPHDRPRYRGVRRSAAGRSGPPTGALRCERSRGGWQSYCRAAEKAQPAVAPPSTGSVAPVTKRASSLRRKATNAAISSGPATRPVGLGAERAARSTSGPTPSNSR